MIVNKTNDGGVLTVAIEGRVDTTTAPQLEESVKADIEGVTELIFDFSNVDYISSAGLRVLLSFQKIMNKQGDMIVKGANDDIKEIFEVTGFSDILTIED